MSAHGTQRMSLRRTLIVVLLGGVLVGGVAQVIATWHTASSAVNAAFDRSLYGAMRAIDASVSTASGGVSVELPYALLEFFELTASAPVRYRVATQDGLVEIGSPDIAMPAQALTLRSPLFETVDSVDGPVRVGTYMRPLTGALTGNLVIQVAEPLASRREFTRQFIVQAIIRDLLLAPLAAGMVAAAVTWALRPLRQLRQEVQARPADDIAPVETLHVPADVLPLVQAMNMHIARYGALLATQRGFLDDASHQLRTPLTTLLTQAGYALREPEEARVRESLQAMRTQLRSMIRCVNQLLVLARADTAGIDAEATDLVALAREMVRKHWPQARQASIDLGFEHDGEAVAACQPGMVEEALANLLDNALRHTPPGGRVTVRVVAREGWARLTVVDTGTGIPSGELPRVAQRFFRASNARGEGTGLGLAIVRAIAERHGGRFELAPAEGGGLLVGMRLPLEGDGALQPKGA